MYQYPTIRLKPQHTESDSETVPDDGAHVLLEEHRRETAYSRRVMRTAFETWARLDNRNTFKFVCDYYHILEQMYESAPPHMRRFINETLEVDNPNKMFKIPLSIPPPPPPPPPQYRTYNQTYQRGSVSNEENPITDSLKKNLLAPDPAKYPNRAPQAPPYQPMHQPLQHLYPPLHQPLHVEIFGRQGIPRVLNQDGSATESRHLQPTDPSRRLFNRSGPYITPQPVATPASGPAPAAHHFEQYVRQVQLERRYAQNIFYGIPIVPSTSNQINDLYYVPIAAPVSNRINDSNNGQPIVALTTNRSDESPDVCEIPEVSINDSVAREQDMTKSPCKKQVSVESAVYSEEDSCYISLSSPLTDQEECKDN